MKTSMSLATLFSLFFALISSPLMAQKSGQSIQIQYGVVVASKYVQEKSNAGKGALVGGSIGQVPELSRDITSELKKAVSIPVINKITPTSLNMAEVAVACQHGGADGIALFGGTSLAAPPVDIYNHGKPIYPLTRNNSFGFISGPWIRLSTYKSVAQVEKQTKACILVVEHFRLGKRITQPVP